MPEPEIDAFTTEIIRSKLLAIASEMGVVLARTSMSPIVYEVLDFACGLTDAEGAVIAQDNGLCLFTGTFRPQVESVLAKWPRERMRPGDIYMTNIPYGGGTHTADIALIAPIFADGQVLAFSVSVTHWTEVGGKVLGSLAPDATEIYQEGLQFPQLRLYREGELNQDIIDMIRANVRLPVMSIGDLNAGIAAVHIAEERMREICRRYGTAAVTSTFTAILDHGERLARAALARIPNGVYEAHDWIDGDGITEDPIPIQVKVTITDDAMIADFTGCAPQVAGPINCARGALTSACKTIFKAITDPQAHSNEGLFRPFQLIIPDGTVFSAVPPAATGWYYESTAYSTELVWKALAPVVPDRLSAGSYVSLCATYIGGRSPAGDYWVMVEPHDGGWGASMTGDGESGLIATTDGDTYNYPVEVAEAKFPVTVERYALNVADGGGAGRRRGGFGLIREYRIENPGIGFINASLGRSVHGPWGAEGGDGGSLNYFEVVSDGQTVRKGRVTNYPLKQGDLVRIVTGNGGGWGPPEEREPELVARDVADGYITLEIARDRYRVIVDAQGVLDAEATATARARLREQTPVRVGGQS